MCSAVSLNHLVEDEKYSILPLFVLSSRGGNVFIGQNFNKLVSYDVKHTDCPFDAITFLLGMKSEKSPNGLMAKFSILTPDCHPSSNQSNKTDEVGGAMSNI